MPPERSAQRLRRILVLVPWVMANPGATVDEVCRRFSLTPAQLTADLEMLFVCGLPPFGPGDLIWATIEGDHVVIEMADYLSKPPRLSRGEAIGLLVMGRALASLPGFEGTDVLRSALDKLAGAVTPADAELAQETASRVAVDLATPGAGLLGDVRRAIDDRARLHITYYSHGRAEMTERDVDPLIAFSMQGNWYVAAYDHLSAEERWFRIDRIKDLSRTGDVFERPDGFDPSTYETAPLFTPSPGDIDVVIEVSASASWIRGFVPYEEETDAGDGAVRLRLRTPHLAWVVRLLLGAGPGARPISPLELVDGVRAAAERALALYAAN